MALYLLPLTVRESSLPDGYGFKFLFVKQRYFLIIRCLAGQLCIFL